MLFIENKSRKVDFITFRKYIIDEDLCEDYDKIEEFQSDQGVVILKRILALNQKILSDF